jgi:hypothetical protein
LKANRKVIYDAAIDKVRRTSQNNVRIPGLGTRCRWPANLPKLPRHQGNFSQAPPIKQWRRRFLA